MRNTILLFLALTACASAQPFNVPHYHRAAASSGTLTVLDSLFVRLDAIDTVGYVTKDAVGYVSAWKDKSPYAWRYLQRFAAFQPRWFPDSINGKPGIYIQGRTRPGLVTDYFTRPQLAGDYTVYVVMRRWGDAIWLSDSAANAQFRAGQSGNTLSIYDGSANRVSSALSTSMTTNATVAIYKRASGTVTFYQGATAYTGGTTSGTMGLKYMGAIFTGGPNGGEYIIGELLIYTVAHDDTQRASVTNYLTTRWGL